MGDYVGKGHVQYFTQTTGIQDLNCVHIYTARKLGHVAQSEKNRKNMPKFQEGMAHGSVELQKGGKVLAINWHDKRQFSILTTLHQGHMVDTPKEDHRTDEPIEKPDAVMDYYINMRLVGKSDCQLASLECIRKTYKCYHKLFFHIVDISMLSAYHMYLVKTGKKPKFREFSYNVVYQFLEKYGIVTQTA